MARTLEGDANTDRSKMGDSVRYAIVKEEHTIRKSSLQLLEQYNRRKTTDTK
jgi:hypothetical protein